jgi:endonuclease-3
MTRQNVRKNPLGESAGRKGGKPTLDGASKKEAVVTASAKRVSKRVVLRRETADELHERAARITATLARLYPKARISLDFATPWQCLVATILSAQCTDERVNRTTPELFARLPDPAAMAAAPTDTVEKLIMPTGFYRQKTKSIQGAARKILNDFGGEIPSRMEDLVTLPGVGRKTANVILGHVYGEPGLVVDTHVRRLARRLGLTQSLEPEVIEMDLGKLMPPREWTPFSMRLILHGRQVCYARRPHCEGCELRPDCPRIGVTGS